MPDLLTQLASLAPRLDSAGFFAAADRIERIISASLKIVHNIDGCPVEITENEIRDFLQSQGWEGEIDEGLLMEVVPILAEQKAAHARLRKICPEIDSPNPMGGKGHEIAPFDPGDDAFSAEFSKTHGVPMGLRGLAGRKVGMGRWALNLEGGGELVNGIKDLFEGAGEDATKLNNTKYFPEMFGGTGATPKIGLSPYEEYAKPSFLPDLNGETAAALEQRQFAQFQQIMDPNTLTGRIYAGLQPEYQRAMFNNFKGGADRTALQNQALEWASNGGGPNPLAYHSGPANLSAGRPQGPSSAYSPGLGLESPQALAAETGVAPAVLAAPGTTSPEAAAAATAGRPLQGEIDQYQRGSAFKASDPRFSPWLTGGLIAGGVGLAGGAALGSSAISDNRDANTVQGASAEYNQIQQQYSTMSQALDTISPQAAQIKNGIYNEIRDAARKGNPAALKLMGNPNQTVNMDGPAYEAAVRSAFEGNPEAQKSVGDPKALANFVEAQALNYPICQQEAALRKALTDMRNRSQSDAITSKSYGGPTLAPLPTSTPLGEMNAIGMDDFNKNTGPQSEEWRKSFISHQGQDQTPGGNEGPDHSYYEKDVGSPVGSPDANLHQNMNVLGGIRGGPSYLSADPRYQSNDRQGEFANYCQTHGIDIRQALSLPPLEFYRQFYSMMPPQIQNIVNNDNRAKAQAAAGIQYYNNGQPVYGTPQSGPPLERSRGNPFGPA